MGKTCCGSGSSSDSSGSFTRSGSHLGRRPHEDSAPCCCCCCCCCGDGGCGKRGATLTFGVIGLFLAAAIIAPPLYLYTSGPDPDYTILFPVLKYGKMYLRKIVEERETAANSTSDNITAGQAYKLAIFQLLEDCEKATPFMAFFSFCMGCVNVPLDLSLIVGACLRKGCPLLPWLVITLVEHLIVGVPLIVFTGLISLYLAAQLELYVVATVLLGSVLIIFFLSLSSWFTIYACYNMFNDLEAYRKQGNNGASYDYGAGPSCDTQLTQPLMTSDQPPPLPDGHPSLNGGYAGGYSAGNISSGQYPSAPPQGMYPSLA